ncbi:MAG TPA: nucleoside triphosphate pyrophosphohydrolase [Candidatus Cloacimonetes bacterium]|nr:nucleoside triphosphate pyrophosphohydrolase [Candidatus Cloacimonadota bacterium]HEX37841.1 nucleoside triphosphate pyrophosphohydrolase [Candidatus Cloacimonadota bacterium]
MKEFDELLEIMKILRDPEKGCPWDKLQTPESLRPHMIEEVYELSEAIDHKDDDLMKEELGDLLLHIVFQAKIAEEGGQFTIQDIIQHINKKMKHRHPHIFGDLKVIDHEDVEHNWEKIKIKEKRHRKSILEGLPKSLPALIKAKQIQSKAAHVGFDWDEVEQIFDKLKEEIKEFEEEYQVKDREKMKDEIGDILFALVNLARRLDIDPEFALDRTIKKFIKRFNFIEEELQEKLFSADLDEMEFYWQKAKENDKE